MSQQAPNIEIAPVGSEIDVTSAGDTLACVQVGSSKIPNPNPKFKTYGVVLEGLAASVMDVLSEASDAPDFPSVLIFPLQSSGTYHADTVLIGNLLDRRVAHAILDNRARLGIKRIILSMVHRHFMIGVNDIISNRYQDISNSVKEYFPSPEADAE